MQNLKGESRPSEKFVYPQSNEDFKLLYKKLKAYARQKLFHKYPALEAENEDLFQEAALALFMELSQRRYQGTASIESYFGSIFLKMCNRAYQKLKPELTFDEVVHSELFGADKLQEDKRQALLEAIEELTDGEKLVITAHYFYGFDYEILALRTGLTEQAIKNRAYKARKKLLTLLTNHPAFKN